MLRAVQKFVAWMKRPRTAADDVQQRHLAWDRECRTRGMTAREQAEELQIRCAWVRLRSKASAATFRRPARWHDILDRVAADEARTLTAIGGSELAAVFLRAYEATNPLEILSPEAGSMVLVRTRRSLASIQSAPPLAPELPPEEDSLRARYSHSRRKQPASGA